MANLFYESDLKIVLWNCRSAMSKFEEIQSLLSDVDILVLNETWLDSQVSNIKFSFAGFVVYRTDRPLGGGGGIAFIVRKNIAFINQSVFFPNPDVEVSSIKITNIEKTITLIAVYKPPNVSPSSAEWETFFAKLSSKEQVIILGDFNAHNVAWNCEKTDVDGSRILSCLNIYKNSILLNFDSKTRIDPRNGKKSNIDLVFCSKNIAHKINYFVHKETCKSDHYPIFMNISIKKHFYHKKSFKVQSTKTNWEKVNEDLEQSYEQMIVEDFLSLTPTEKYEYFINLIYKTVEQSTPKKKKNLGKKHRNPVFW